MIWKVVGVTRTFKFIICYSDKVVKLLSRELKALNTI